jgi:hypothetical protein
MPKSSTAAKNLHTLITSKQNNGFKSQMKELSICKSKVEPGLLATMRFRSTCMQSIESVSYEYLYTLRIRTSAFPINISTIL